ncbi:MAG: hypothetical protein Q7S59_02920 [Sulfurimonas sp.]|nr:hypothetical protein [Sulfurimonas sp.]
MIPLFPFFAGATLGVVGAIFLNNKKTRKKLYEGKEYLQEKISESKESLSAMGECIKEKSTEKKSTKKESTNESDSLV